ncbi:MAG TPA: response regulator [Blastocatellia bacterium]|nr:response regulator [Blastocatellia bacterium]
MKILIAEDSRVNQALVALILKKQGHTVRVADNGVQAVAAVEQEPFDLVLMDLHMPEMGGLEAATRIREWEARSQDETIKARTTVGSAGECDRRDPGGQVATSRIPIIAMTASDTTNDRERCLEAGMDEYIRKPVVAQHLLELIARFEPSEVSAWTARPS